MNKDWNRHAALLDMQPNNRRFIREARTPRTLREAGLTDWPWGSDKFDTFMAGVCCGACPWLLVMLAGRIWG